MCLAKYAAMSTDVRRGQLLVRCADAVNQDTSRTSNVKCGG